MWPMRIEHRGEYFEVERVIGAAIEEAKSPRYLGSRDALVSHLIRAGRRKAAAGVHKGEVPILCRSDKIGTAIKSSRDSASRGVRGSAVEGSR